MTAGMLSIPAVFMRGGTSKGLFFHVRDLPQDRSARDAIFLRALGSPDSYGRQLDGMGGGLSSLSKAVIIGPPTREGADLDYTFVQVSVGAPLVDYGGTCGNLASAAGQFAVDEGLIATKGAMAIVRIHAVNTGKVIRAHVPVRDGKARVDGALVIPGLSFGGAPIRLEFVDPDGSRTGRLLPSGQPVDLLDIAGVGSIRASLVDAVNPCVFVGAADLGLTGAELPEELDADVASRALLEAIRAAAGVRMGFGATPEAVSHDSQSSPKIALVAPARTMRTLDGASLDSGSLDLCVRMISMGQSHRAVPLTGALCVAVAARIPGTIVHDALANSARGQGDLRIGTASGVVPVAAEVIAADGGFRTHSAVAYRTARRLMEGNVLVPILA
ncbi:2-methylaconitate cis-trans isomerase PrpF family protein [Sphingomonas sp. CL5.1]|uniref:2-methylaconitate cis-trans isomerase PrpF family protein n=1 Tax=Sphingomonas sp. CL5.1 TaxID=2653203 RepID=UPI001C2E7354|nr:PrpF domain-containing protein [Sphingomonas sp. CL5.1]